MPTLYKGNGNIGDISGREFDYYNQRILPFVNRRIVFKVGSSLLDFDNNPGYMERIARELTHLRKNNNQIVLVSSGAIFMGKKYLISKSDNHSINVMKAEINDEPALIYSCTIKGKFHSYSEQSLASKGQPRLIKSYIDEFDKFNQEVGQALFNRADVENGKNKSSKQYKSTLATLENLLSNDDIPIINENDTTATDEIIFGDNAILAAHVAVALKADLVVYNTSEKGLYERVDGKNGKLINVVFDIDDCIRNMAEGSSKNPDGTYKGRGGMRSTIEGIEILKGYGIPALIIGKDDLNFESINHYTHNGTLFLNE